MLCIKLMIRSKLLTISNEKWSAHEIVNSHVDYAMILHVKILFLSLDQFIESKQLLRFKVQFLMRFKTTLNSTLIRSRIFTSSEHVHNDL